MSYLNPPPAIRSLLAAAAVFVLEIAPAARAEVKRGPFTEPPRSVRSRDVDQRHIALDLDFDFEKESFAGRATLHLVPYREIRGVTLDAAEMRVLSVRRRGEHAATDGADKPLKYRAQNHKLTIELDRPYAAGEKLVLVIRYRVEKPRFGAHFVSPDKREPSQPRMVWTQSEPEYARYWFPCVDTPADRVSSEIRATVPRSFMVLSNGVLKSKQPVDGDRQSWHWVMPKGKNHVPYLLSVVAGEFEAYEQKWRDLPIISYVPKGRLVDAPRSFEKTPAMMELFNDKIGFPYPWSKYTQICVDEYNWGGMEHTSATTLNLSTLHDERAHLDVSSDNLVAHELAHQWWGNLVTCKDWAELWLNESFATYFATLWTEHDKGWDEAAWQRHREGIAYKEEDSKRYRRPLVTYRYQQPFHMFDRHSYPKGGRILHMLRFVLGDDQFWRAIKHYAHRHAYRSVETADFRTSVEEATGRPLTWFFNQWIHRGGHPEFEVSWRWDEAARVVRLNVKQTQKIDELTPLFRTPVEIKLVVGEKPIVRRVEIFKAEHSFHFAVKERPRRVCFDPRDWILKDLKFDKSKQEWIDQLAHDGDVMCRARAAEALAEFHRDEDARDALLAGLAGDKFWGVREQAAKSLAKFRGEKPRGGLLAAAKTDQKSFVRRAAIQSLKKYSHKTTLAALREIIETDRSYYAVAEALKALAALDRKNARADLLAALPRRSHREVILQAAAEGLAQVGGRESLAKLLEILKEPSAPERRIAVLKGIAKLGGSEPAVITAIKGQLSDSRSKVRKAAIEALGESENAAALDLLTGLRGAEKDPRLAQAIDRAADKLRAGQKKLDRLQRQLEELRRANRDLETRLKKLEEKQRESG